MLLLRRAGLLALTGDLAGAALAVDAWLVAGAGAVHGGACDVDRSSDTDLWLQVRGVGERLVAAAVWAGEGRARQVREALGSGSGSWVGGNGASVGQLIDGLMSPRLRVVAAEAAADVFQCRASSGSSGAAAGGVAGSGAGGSSGLDGAMEVSRPVASALLLAAAAEGSITAGDG